MSGVTITDVTRLALHAVLAGCLFALAITGDPEWRSANIAIAVANAWFALIWHRRIRKALEVRA